MQLNQEKDLMLIFKAHRDSPTIFYDFKTKRDLIELDIGHNQSLLYTCTEAPFKENEAHDNMQQKSIHSFIFSSRYYGQWITSCLKLDMEQLRQNESTLIVKPDDKEVESLL